MSAGGYTLADLIGRIPNFSGTSSGGRGDCPLCGGKNTLSIRENGKLLMHCHKCGAEFSALLDALIGRPAIPIPVPVPKKNPTPPQNPEKIYEQGRIAPPSHPYLKAKGVGPVPGLKQAADGRLMVPVNDFKGNLYGLQFIDDRGTKRFLKGTVKKGHFFQIGELAGRAYIAEGLATGITVHQATNEAVFLAFDCGNLQPVAEAVRQRNPDIEIIIGVDNDQFKVKNPGLVHGRKAAAAVGGLLAIPEFRDLGGEPTDFNDLANREGVYAVLEQLEAAVPVAGEDLRKPEPDTISRRFHLEPVGDLLDDIQAPEWTVENWLEKNSLACIFGEAGSMKSFVAIDLALAIAYGLPWHGHDTPGSGAPVAYIAGEGRRGILRRVAGWRIQHRIEEKPPFFLSTGCAQFLESRSFREVRAAIREVEEQVGKPVLIVIDTLNRNFGPGDENDTRDMTRFISACDKLREETGAAILIVHHVGVNDNGRARGSGVLRGAMDVEIKCKKSTMLINLTATKVKDARHPEPLCLRPMELELPYQDKKGRPLTTLVLDDAELPAPESVKVKLPPSTQFAYDILRKLAADGEPVHVEQWRKECYRRGIADGPAARRQAFSRARNRLLMDGLVTCVDDFYQPETIA